MSESLTVDHHWTSDNILQVIVSASGPVRIDWGDSTPVETVAAVSSNPHTYSKAGNYKVQVLGPTGLRHRFGVVAGRPMQAHRVTKGAEKRQELMADSIALAHTTGVLNG